jgi:hypothetical protein
LGSIYGWRGVESKGEEMVLAPNGGDHGTPTGSGDASRRSCGQDDMHAEIVGRVVAQGSCQQPETTPAERLTIDGEPSSPRLLGHPRPLHYPRQAQKPAVQALDAGGKNVLHALKYA